MNIKKAITVGVMLAVASVMALDYVEVIDVAARQRYPWNGLVDIDFELDSHATEPYMMKVIVFDNVGKTNLPVRTCYTEGVSYKENPCMVRADTRHILWDAAADLPNGFRATNVLVSCQDMRTQLPSNTYMIVDLSGATNTEAFPISYTNCPPAGGWTEEYMLTKIVLRRIEPGVFWRDSGQKYQSGLPIMQKVKLTKPYYIAVYELTASQYALICGGTGSDTTPVSLDWGTIRGFDVDSAIRITQAPEFDKSFNMNLKVAQLGTITNSYPESTSVSSSSLMGRLRAKTGFAFDLPTEAQWERACRAGASSPLYTGYTNTSTEAAVIQGAAKLDPTGTHYIYVGNYVPNAYGLYDMLGNVAEWCLDAYHDTFETADACDPTGGDSVISEKIFTGQINQKYCYYENLTIKCGSQTWTRNPGAGVVDGYMMRLSLTYNGFQSCRVVKGGDTNSGWRSGAMTVNNSGTLFVDGVVVKGKSPDTYLNPVSTTRTYKFSYTNPTHGVRIALTVDE